MSDGCVAIVLARGGSVGLPRKNVLGVAGRPCIAWTIEAALDAPCVDRVVVSSDDDEVLAIAASMGVAVHRRPDDLASATARVDDAAREAAAAHGGDPIVVLYGNVPVRPAGLIDRAIALLAESGADSVQSYAPVGKHHPWWTARVDVDTGAVKPWEGDVLNHGVFRRQDLPSAHIPDGGVIALTRRALMLEVPGAGDGPHAFFGVDRRGVVTGEGEVVDIDSRVDLLVADAVLSGLRSTTENTEGTEGDGDRVAGRRTGLVDEALTGKVIGAAIDVHRALGPGLLESAYEACLIEALVVRGIPVASQVPLAVSYGGRRVDVAYRMDVVVDGRVLVEVKAVDALAPIHEAQLMTYLRLSGLRVGLLMNFNAAVLRDGIKRRVL